MDDYKLGFPPVVAADTRLLILGSLPGDRSLRAKEYYAHPRNQFWDLMSDVLSVSLRPMGYLERLTTLRAYKVGLWDVIASAQRPGSLDTAIRDIAANPLAALIASLPDLAGIAFNGRLAYTRGRAILSAPEGISLVPLPSSSPAHAVGIDNKRAAWMALREV